MQNRSKTLPMTHPLTEAGIETMPSGTMLDETASLGALRKFQEPTRFQKARFQLKLYKQTGADFH